MLKLLPLGNSKEQFDDIKPHSYNNCFFHTPSASASDDDFGYVVIAEEFDGPPRVVYFVHYIAATAGRAMISVDSFRG